MPRRPGGLSVSTDEVCGMWTWARALMRLNYGEDVTGAEARRDRVTRQELAALFADDLAICVQHARRKPRGRGGFAGRQSGVRS